MVTSKRDLRGTWPQALGSLALSALVILTVRWALFEPYLIPSGSMIPSLLVHDHILVNKFSFGVRLPFSSQWLVRFGKPSRGEVIVFRSLDQEGVFLVKRVVGLPGEEVSFDENGVLKINGVPVRERVLSDAEIENLVAKWPKDERETAKERFHFFEEHFPDGGHHFAMRENIRAGDGTRGPFLVPNDSIFMVGDNRDNSADSRVWGAIRFESVLGVASFIWLSCEETLADVNQVCDPGTVRWERLFEGIR